MKSTIPIFSLLAAMASVRIQAAPASTATHEVSAAYSYSSSSDLKHDGGVLGAVEVDHYGFVFSTLIPRGQGLSLHANLHLSRDELGATNKVPLPDRLNALGLGLGATKEIAPGWKVSAMFAPGIAGDSSAFSSDNFNLRGGIVFLRDMSPDLSWNLGLAATLRGEYPLLPVLGLRWKWAPDWTLSFGFPSTAVIYQATPALALRLGVGGQGGSYHVDQPQAAGLGDTYLQYREIRAGLTATYRIKAGFSIELEGGSVIDRRFDYYDRGYLIKGDSASYFNLGVRLRL